MTARRVWGAVLGSVALLDVICDRRGDNSTLSCVTRETVKGLGPAGPVVFTAACIGVPLWFWRHILKPIREGSFQCGNSIILFVDDDDPEFF